MKCALWTGFLVWFLLSPPQVRGQDEMFAEELRVSKRKAVFLSALFPGLGQMASGHKVKGGALLFSELLALIVAVDAHEEYNTRLNVYEESLAAYEAMRVGGNHGDAEERWQELNRIKKDLDGLHNRRLAFAYPAIGIYIASLIDIALLREQGKARKQGVEAAFINGAPGVVVWKKF